MTPYKLNTKFNSQSPTADKVIQVLQVEEVDITMNPVATLYYLKTYIRSISKEKLHNL